MDIVIVSRDIIVGNIASISTLPHNIGELIGFKSVKKTKLKTKTINPKTIT